MNVVIIYVNGQYAIGLTNKRGITRTYNGVSDKQASRFISLMSEFVTATIPSGYAISGKVPPQN